MARQLSDDPATLAVPAVPGQTPLQGPAGALDSAISESAVAAAIALSLGLGALAAWAVQAPASVQPSLASLLQLMVAIKALIFAGAGALVLLRLRGPVAGGALGGYCLGLGMSAAALAWLWGLSGMLAGSALFYGGLVLTYLTASRDPLLAAGLQRGAPSRRRLPRDGRSIG